MIKIGICIALLLLLCFLAYRALAWVDKMMDAYEAAENENDDDYEMLW